MGLFCCECSELPTAKLRRIERVAPWIVDRHFMTTIDPSGTVARSPQILKKQVIIHHTAQEIVMLCHHRMRSAAYSQVIRSTSSLITRLTLVQKKLRHFWGSYSLLEFIGVKEKLPPNCGLRWLETASLKFCTTSGSMTPVQDKSERKPMKLQRSAKSDMFVKNCKWMGNLCHFVVAALVE
ncbi:hypothetical protein T4B_13169 [Trichinella pseudospiralis]|uniref:Uncharacterized protein n=1 Tax=Trichinella pseudospiralis TaxID=6337 RepID=A0A0V1IW54_TRIPS|nr:hypothetical protein T4B_13169 [Trichinella pseudospiralis]